MYLVEAYRSGAPGPTHRAVLRVRAAAEAHAVRLLGRLVIASDETEFWLFEADSLDDLNPALAAAGVGGSRISAVDELSLFGAAEPHRRQ